MFTPKVNTDINPLRTFPLHAVTPRNTKVSQLCHPPEIVASNRSNWLPMVAMPKFSTSDPMHEKQQDEESMNAFPPEKTLGPRPRF